ncbi:MAG: holo-ACP synthase [Vagococcus salmoninarum]|uniref:holo-ACP synthase n=1 Tax=Vagococcus salmoninarum TaxID=2739 RepID=UPI003F9AA3DB
MIKGIGVDIVEMERIQKIISDNLKFVDRVLTDKEYERFASLKGRRQVEYLAGRFACKEAFSKAYGTGIGKLTLQDIEILTGERGEPIVTKSPFKGNVHVSISHTDSIAIGQILLEE